MSSGIAFESSRLKEIKRQEKRDARQKVLDQAKKQHEKEQYKKEQAKLRGEDKWMLPALSERIDKEQQELKRKSKKEKKKKKKHKKEKKQNKHVSSSDSSDDDEDESSDKDSVWIEKMDDRSTPSEQTLIKGPRLQRDSWMEAPLDLIPLTSRQEIRNKEKQNLEGEQKKNPVEQLGQHERELNPYWKDGGTGLPEEYVEKAEKPSAQLNIGDGGLSWMKKAYQRCVEQAKEENRTLEDVAIEKYGSLKKLEDKLAEAEDAYMKVQKNRTEGANKYDRGKRNDSGRSRMFMKPSDDDSKSRIDSKDRYRDRKRSRSRERRARSRSRSPYRRERNRSRSNDRYNISRSRSRERRKNHRSRSRSADRSRYSRSRSKERGRSHRSKESNRRRSRSRSYDRHDRSSAAELSSSKDCVNSKINDSQSFASRSSALKSRFMKPGEIARNSNYGEDRYTPKSRDTVPAWKKKEFMKPKEEPTSKDSKTEHNRSEVQSESKRRKPMPDTSESSSSSQSEDSGSESEQSDHKDDQNSKEEEILILSEQEMNQLGAKIVRAEIMGDNELAGKLKQQLEKARENNEKYKQDAAAATGGAHSATKESENVVVLTRTNKKGMVIPLSEARHQREKGRKRKKTKVQTHSDQGERQRYFADDDKFDLKQMVEREKMGTAEDQNMMFARLAGRSMEKADEDYQMDDVIVSRASMAKSEAKMEERDRAHAIFEHRKMSAALEKCNFCFENVPKHLIIAIGMKVYLCLPNHKSLTDGHCLIVPMQHVAAGTAVDEDVWSEIQVFRKGITKMFETMDQDVVFMETCMGLRSHPHMHLECIPLPKETGDMAPIYFKKAILECDTEWAQNKKLVDLSKKDVRRSIPKGFPYFAVDFGLQGGFAHAIEDEQKFPRYFGKEVVGGMVDAEPRLWRKPQKENFDDQRKKVLEFAEWWKPYDWTQRLHQDDT